MNEKFPKKNKEGYSDPTAYTAVTLSEEEDERFHKLLRTLFYICDIAGFQIEGRITLVDRESGKVWK